MILWKMKVLYCEIIYTVISLIVMTIARDIHYSDPIDVQSSN